MSSSVATDSRTRYSADLRTAISRRLDDYATAADDHLVALDELLCGLNGADPLVVINELRRLAPADPRAAAVAQAASAGPGGVATVPSLPIPHPLDYAWRFTASSCETLTRRLATLTGAGDRVVHLGTPTLHAYACAHLPDREHVLLDADLRLIRAARRAGRPAVVTNLLGPELPRLSAAACVADPPWYPAETSCFANAAARILEPGGSLLLAFAGALTRPGVDDDLAAVVGAAAHDALRLDSSEVGLCRYVTPPFEYAAMAAAGLQRLPPQWRTGDLLVFRRVDAPAPDRRTAPRDGWTGVEIADVPLRVRVSAPPVGKHLLTPLIAGDVLATVSRRAPERAQAALWTSRNRIFGSCDPATLSRIVANLAAGREALPHARLAAHEQAAGAAVLAVIALERAEHGLSPLSRPGGV